VRIHRRRLDILLVLQSRLLLHLADSGVQRGKRIK
jgi:hypothetical protein